MRTFLLYRLSALPALLLALSLLCFFLAQAIPGGPMDALLAPGKQGAVPYFAPTQRAELNSYFGFEKDLLTRYRHWLGKLLSGNLGTSLRYEKPVVDLITSALPITIKLAVGTLLLLFLFFLPLGAWGAYFPNLFVTRALRSLCLFLYSLPAFILAMTGVFLFGVKENAFLLPLLCCATGSGAYYAELFRSSLSTQLSQDYVIAARSRGLPESIVFLHVLRNALVPLTAHTGTWTTAFLGGSLMIETVFNLQGMGRLSYTALLARDYPVLLGVVLVTGVGCLLANLLADLCATLLDPRLKIAHA